MCVLKFVKMCESKLILYYIPILSVIRKATETIVKCEGSVSEKLWNATKVQYGTTASTLNNVMSKRNILQQHVPTNSMCNYLISELQKTH
jgi:hypothetical protein